MKALEELLILSIRDASFLHSIRAQRGVIGWEAK
jgi:hypothetical protein